MAKLIMKWSILVLGLALLSGGLQSSSEEKTQDPPKAVQQTAVEKAGDIHVPPPPFTDGLFPCSECHADMEPNPTHRVLEEAHDDIVLKHDEGNRWCLDCHDAKNRDQLHLADGRPVDFKESYKLCGQCHGPKLRDWKAGVHGRRTGKWNGQKEYLLCAHCHNPHSPKFIGLKPLPAPIRPENLR